MRVLSENIFNTTIKTTVHSFFPDARILLFGSRARNEQQQDSDFDVLVIIKQTLPEKEKLLWLGKLHKTLVYALNAPVDVLMNSEEEVQIKKNLPGHVVRWAIKEGIEL